MCSRTNCEAKPEWRPVLVISVPGQPKRQLRAVIGIGLCLVCKYKTTLPDVLSDDGWDMMAKEISKQFQLNLTRDCVKLEFIWINSKESKAFETIKRAHN